MHLRYDLVKYLGGQSVHTKIQSLVAEKYDEHRIWYAKHVARDRARRNDCLVSWLDKLLALSFACTNSCGMLVCDMIVRL